MKRFFFLLSLVLALTLGACQGGSPAPEETEAPPAAPTASEATETPFSSLLKRRRLPAVILPNRRPLRPSLAIRLLPKNRPPPMLILRASRYGSCVQGANSAPTRALLSTLRFGKRSLRWKTPV